MLSSWLRDPFVIGLGVDKRFGDELSGGQALGRDGLRTTYMFVFILAEC
jgi:hypothetical protein